MAFFVSAAVVGSGILGAGASIYAANKQSDAAQNALNFQKQTFDTNQSNMKAAQGTLAPYLNVGSNATYTLGQLTGTGGTPGNGGNVPDYSSFFKDPSYTFAQQQGELGIERGANARGLNLSGGTLKDLATFNSGLASQQYGNYFSRLMGLSQLGQNATNTNANLVTGNASNNTAGANGIANTTMAQGQAQASGAVGVANAANGAVGNSLMYNYLNRNPSGYQSTGGLTGNSNAVGAGTDAQYNAWGLQNGLQLSDI